MAVERSEIVTAPVRVERARCSCGQSLGLRNTSGKCRTCHNKWLNSDPEIVARRREKLRAWVADPAVKSMLRDRMATTMSNLSEAEIERRRANGKVLARTVLNRPDVLAITTSPEVRAKAGRSRTNTVLAWCPLEFRHAYRELTISKRMPAADARRVIEQRMRVAALGPDVDRWQAEREMFGRAAVPVRVRTVAPPPRKLIDLNAVPSSMERRYAR